MARAETLRYILAQSPLLEGQNNTFRENTRTYTVRIIHGHIQYFWI